MTTRLYIINLCEIGVLRLGNIGNFRETFFRFLDEYLFISPSSRCLHVLPDVFLEYILITNYTHRVW